MSLIEEVLRGSLGTRWSATWTDAKGNDRPATVWVVPLTALASGEANQVLAASACSVGVAHPSAVELLDVIWVGEELWAVSKHVPGLFLASLLDEVGRGVTALPVGAVLRIVLDLARGALAVRRAIAPVRPTRLIWPQACLIGSSGAPLLMDVPLVDAYAKCTAPRSQASVVAEFAPEQLASKPRGESADVFALGQILWRFLAGRPPPPERGLADTSSRVALGFLPPLASTDGGAHLPEDIVMLVDRALHREPRGRHASLAEFIAAVDAMPQSSIAPLPDVAALLEALGHRDASGRVSAASAPQLKVRDAPTKSRSTAGDSSSRGTSGTFPLSEAPTRPNREASTPGVPSVPATRAPKLDSDELKTVYVPHAQMLGSSQGQGPADASPAAAPAKARRVDPHELETVYIPHPQAVASSQGAPTRGAATPSPVSVPRAPLARADNQITAEFDARRLAAGSAVPTRPPVTSEQPLTAAHDEIQPSHPTEQSPEEGRAEPPSPLSGRQSVDGAHAEIRRRVRAEREALAKSALGSVRATEQEMDPLEAAERRSISEQATLRPPADSTSAATTAASGDAGAPAAGEVRPSAGDPSPHLRDSAANAESGKLRRPPAAGAVPAKLSRPSTASAKLSKPQHPSSAGAIPARLGRPSTASAEFGKPKRPSSAGAMPGKRPSAVAALPGDNPWAEAKQVAGDFESARRTATLRWGAAMGLLVAFVGTVLAVTVRPHAAPPSAPPSVGVNAAPQARGGTEPPTSAPAPARDEPASSPSPPAAQTASPELAAPKAAAVASPSAGPVRGLAVGNPSVSPPVSSPTSSRSLAAVSQVERRMGSEPEPPLASAPTTEEAPRPAAEDPSPGSPNDAPVPEAPSVDAVAGEGAEPKAPSGDGTPASDNAENKPTNPTDPPANDGSEAKPPDTKDAEQQRPEAAAPSTPGAAAPGEAAPSE